MKNRHFLLALLIQFSLAGFSQIEGPTEPKLPQVFPVTPEAASLGKYGDVPVNLATGKINYTVPLYTIKVKDFEWPIYLSYNYGGLLVEEDPSIVGLGWDFIATGRITREIRGIPDEFDNTNFKKNYVVPYLKGDFDNSTNYESTRYYIYNQIANLNKDGQFDKYVVSAGDVNGSYVFDENDAPVFLTHRNYIAEKDFIIDDKGIKYYFDEIENGEYTISSNGESIGIEAPVSYLLTKIVLPNNNGEILFTYEPNNPSNPDSYYKTVWTDTEITGLENKITHQSNEVLVDYRRLKEISFPNGKVKFNITPHNQTYTFQNNTYTKRNYTLNTVSVFTIHDQVNPLLKYDFTYNNNIRSKKLLKSIIKYGSNGAILPFYEFSYKNETQVGDFFDYTAQDSWGYYNGQGASTLIQATREIDTVKTKYGALQNIQYPTGGSTSIEYQQNTIFSDDPNTTVQCSYTHNKNKTFRINPDSPGVTKNVDITFDVGHSQIVKLRITAAVKKGTTSNALGSWADISVTANNASQYCGQSTISNFSLYADAENCSSYPNPNDCWGDLILTKEIIGYAGDGILHITGSVMELANKEAYIEYSVDFEQSSKGINNKKLGGIRVSSTTDCDNLGNCYTNKYKYVLENGLTSSGVVMGGTPQFEYSSYHVNGTQTGTKNYRSSRSNAPFTSYQGSPVLYERVEIIKNSGLNGKTVNYYTKGDQNTNPPFPFMPAVNYDWKKGKLKSSDVIALNNGILEKVKNVTNTYSVLYPYGSGSTSTKKVYGMAVSRSRWVDIGPDDPDDYTEDYNYEIDKEYNLIGSITKDFFDVSIITSTDYTYDLPYSQLVEKSVTRSGEGTIKQKMYYPYFNVYSPYYDDILKAQNKVSIPVSQELYNVLSNGTEELLSAQHTDYGVPGGPYFPYRIQTLKGSGSLEDRIIYHSYYNNGNIKEISKKDGSKIVYIWGYNEQYPIAKIENADFSDIPVSIYNSIISTSDSDDDNCTDLEVCDEKYLRDELNKLRDPSLAPNLSGTLITTYTYNPLTGPTSITDPKGYTIYYEYDEFGRLIQVKDAAGKILSENTYHYKDQ